MSRWFDATINSLFTTNKYKKNENKKKETERINKYIFSQTRIIIISTGYHIGVLVFSFRFFRSRLLKSRALSGRTARADEIRTEKCTDFITGRGRTHNNI